MTARPRFQVPAARTRVVDEVKGSRFIATADRASTVDEARTVIDSVREEFANATHNCWAYVAGPPGTLSASAASDDGEPGGTAGRPMLNVLIHSDLGEIAVVVTRFFGGVKLGRGGLVRAYSNSVRRVIRELPQVEYVTRCVIRVSVPYTLADVTRHVASLRDARIVAESFTDEASFDISVAVDDAEVFIADVREATSGSARIVTDV